MPRCIGLVLVLALVILSATGFAQTAAARNVFLGYSFDRASTGWSSTGNLSGWELSGEATAAPHLGFVGDLSTHYGTLQLPSVHVTGPGNGTYDLTTRVFALMFGPRVSVSVGKFRPYANALVGVGHLHEDALDYSHGENALADALGGGVDYQVIKQFAWRVQGDLLQTRYHGGRQENARFSTGLVMNF